MRHINAVLILFIILFLYSTGHAEPQASDKAGSYYDFGVFAFQDGDNSQAEKNFKNAIELDSANPLYHHALGKVYLKTGRYREAAQYLKAAYEKNPHLPGLRYDLAMLSFKTEDYQNAAKLFTEVFQKEPSDILARYHAAVSLFKQKRCQEAIVYFEDIAQKHPSLAENCLLYAGVCYLESEESQKAIEKFEYLRDHTQSKDMKANALKWLDVAQKQKKTLKPYTLFLKIAYQHDDNVRLQPSDASADTKDTGIEAYVFGKYNLLNEKDKKLSVGYTHYQLFHSDLSEYDMTGSIFSLSYKYSWNPLSFEISYLPSYYWVGSSNYLMREQIKPQLSWNITPRFSTRFSWTYSGNNYFDNNDRDGDGREYALDLYYVMNIGYIYGGAAYEDYGAEAVSESYHRRMAKIGGAFNLPFALSLDVMGKYTDKFYDGIYPSYDAQRKDRQYSGNITLSRRLFYPWLSVGVELNATRNDSNIHDYDYSQKMVGVSLTAVY